MKYWTDEETGMNISEPDCADEWLADIWAIGCDYDGCNTVESLKELVDELIEMAHNARLCLYDNKLFGAYGAPEKYITNFTIATAEEGDWQALYTNGKLAAEAHELRAIDVLDCIADILPNKVSYLEVPQDIAEMGMPKYLDDLEV